MEHLGAKIDKYTEGLFADLGLSDLSEEAKADLFARVEEQLHSVILEEMSNLVSQAELEALHETLDREDYGRVSRVLKQYPGVQTELERRIDQQLKELKLTIRKEQNNV